MFLFILIWFNRWLSMFLVIKILGLKIIVYFVEVLNNIWLWLWLNFWFFLVWWIVINGLYVVNFLRYVVLEWLL